MSTLNLRHILSFIAFAGIVLGLAACQRALKPEASCSFMQNSDVQRVSWKHNLPIPLYIHASVPQAAYPSIEEAINVYARILKREVFVIRGVGVTSPSSPGRDGYSVIYWMSTWDPNRPDEQARTTSYWSGDQVYEADLQINASTMSAFNFHYTQNSSTVQGLDLKSLMVHELGHILGLDHTEAQGSVMNTKLPNNVSRAEPSTQDVANLGCEYH